MKSYWTWVLAAIAVLTCVPAASAQSIAEPRTWTATPFLGISFGMSQDVPVSFPTFPNLDSSLGLGVAIGYDLTRNLGFEGELGYVFDVVNDDNTVDWSLTNVSGNAVYHFDVKHVTPYATFGLGIEHSSVDVAPNSLALSIPSSTEVAFNFGGVKYPITRRVVARADLRRFEVNDAAPDHWRVYGGLTFTTRR